jgi:bacillithiol biosynthesis cysteine-adding enzyme BshC
MRILHQDYSELHLLSGIIADYQKHSSSLAPFIAEFPSAHNLLAAAEKHAFSKQKREVLHKTLNAQYSEISVSSEVRYNLDSLLSENTFTITTGHQLCVGTGPVFFVYKIISAIKLAQQMNALAPHMHFVPVYWMASEDHDFEEINHVFVQNKKIAWNAPAAGAVGRLSTSGMESFWEELKGAWPAEPNWPMQVESIRLHYTETTLARGTMSLVNALFGKYGLVVLDPDHADLKNLFKQELLLELESQPSELAVEKASAALAQRGYHTQVTPRNINLFYLENGVRERIEKAGEYWKVRNTELTFGTQELMDLVHSHPEKFSPNVVLRPVYQEVILPNLAYIGGPGELNYWMQLKPVFEAMSVQFPILVLRNNALVISSKLLERIDKSGFGWKAFFNPKEELVKAIVGTQHQELMKGYQDRLNDLYAELSAVLGATDPTLEASAKAELQKASNGLENLEKKLNRAFKTKEEQKIQQVERILSELKPDGATQDRSANFFELNIKAGGNLIEELLEAFDPLNNTYSVCFAD